MSKLAQGLLPAVKQSDLVAFLPRCETTLTLQTRLSLSSHGAWMQPVHFKGHSCRALTPMFGRACQVWAVLVKPLSGVECQDDDGGRKDARSAVTMVVRVLFCMRGV